jgi:signal transduction histidine kinase
MRPEIDRRKLRVASDLRPAPLTGDPALVERLASNLIDNAIRHNDARGNVEVATATRDGRALLSVSNTGPPVPPGDVEWLFQPFRRLGPDRVRRIDGHGLGLSIVQAVADAHEATVHASARPEGGLRVEVTWLQSSSGDEA